jgi:hypothetical protein
MTIRTIDSKKKSLWIGALSVFDPTGNLLLNSRFCRREAFTFKHAKMDLADLRKKLWETSHGKQEERKSVNG